MDLEGKNAATTHSVREIDADGKGNASGSSGEGRPSAGPDSLNVQPDDGNFQSSAGPDSLDIEPGNGSFRSPIPKAAIREREPHQPAQISILRRADATKLFSPEIEAARAAARAERRDPAYEPDPDDGSALRQRKNLRRPGP